MRMPSDDHGFTLIEVLVTMSLFSVLAIGFYSVMFSGVTSGQTTEAVTNISSEARSGFNRMVRDTREAQRVEAPTASSYRVLTDFNGDGLFQNPNSRGDFEDVTFACVDCDPGPGRITLNGETLMEGVLVRSGRPIFEYSSNLLEYDWDGDGVTTCAELNEGPSRGVVGVGNSSTNPVCDSGEERFLSNVTFNLQVESNGRRADFYAQAQMRNRR